MIITVVPMVTRTAVTNAMKAVKNSFFTTFTEIANIVKEKMTTINTNMTDAFNTMKVNANNGCTDIKTAAIHRQWNIRLGLQLER